MDLMVNATFWEWGSELEFDSQMRLLYGLQDGEAVSLERWQQFVHPEDQDLFQWTFQQVRATGQRVHLDVRMKLLAGECRVLLQASPMGGRWLGSQRVSPDCARFQDREQIFQAIFESMFHFIGLCNMDGALIKANRRALEFAGVSEADVIGKLFWTTPWWSHDPLQQKRLVESFARARMGESVRFDATHLGRDGRVRQVDFSLRPVMDEKGQIFNIVPEGRDVTQERLVSQALYESQERFASAFEFAGIGMALVSLEGRWTKVNRALCDIVGYSEDELLVLTFQDITHPDDLQADLALVGELLSGALPSYTMEKRYFRKDGEAVWILLTASLVRTNAGAPLYFVAQIQDISERRSYQQHLLDSLLEKEAMLHEIHHRVKNNLQVVNSILSLQSLSLPDPALKTVFDECQSRIHCMSMIHERLYESNEFSSIDLGEHLRDLVQLCARSHSSDLKLNLDIQRVRVSLDTAIPVSLVANEVFSNCLKHHGGESMRLWLRLVAFPGSGFRLEIRDDGPGFPEGIANATSLGIKLIRRLSQQLRAKIQFQNWEEGAGFELVMG
ncbi:MAG: PAS domain S-box protein [Candidatus Eremiobacteraeota bacterium]|nr:PAS domain S-box protein [Candidatus Eremiobacteraeota bacterium]